MALSLLQVDFFRRSGYLLLRKQLPVGVTRPARKIAKTTQWSKPASFKGNKPIKVYGIFQREIEAFRQIILTDGILDPLESLLGPNIEYLLNRHNSLTFNERGDIPERLHRDILQWSRDIITVMVYLDRSTTRNGCTRIVPTSQYLPFVGTPNNGGTWMDEHSVYSDLIEQAKGN